MGRHGGINILHQKSWHVWRLDNRLTVERDELQHAAEINERNRAREQEAFDAKICKLRRRALGDLEPDHDRREVADHDKCEPTCSGGSGGSASSSKRPSRGSSYKYGMVTLSNLKQAETDLDQKLNGTVKPQRYWGQGSLGTGQHINLFEEAEQEQRLHLADQEKQLRYTQTNNELSGKSKKRLFSEFDEVVASVPWYAKSRESLDDAPLAQAHQRDDASTLRYKRHGQLVTSHSLQRGRLQQDSVTNTEVACQHLGQPKHVQGCESPSSRKKGRAKREALELSKLRTEREQRERQEAARAAQLMAKHRSCAD